jgi:antitoxin component of MazEF toxin-antitoxin module
MIKKLTKVGNSLALVIDRPILELLNLDAQTPLEVHTNGRTLTISPASEVDLQDGRKRKVAEALGRVNKRYAKALKRLAM